MDSNCGVAVGEAVGAGVGFGGAGVDVGERVDVAVGVLVECSVGAGGSGMKTEQPLTLMPASMSAKRPMERTKTGLSLPRDSTASSMLFSHA